LLSGTGRLWDSNNGGCKAADFRRGRRMAD